MKFGKIFKEGEVIIYMDLYELGTQSLVVAGILHIVLSAGYLSGTGFSIGYSVLLILMGLYSFLSLPKSSAILLFGGLLSLTKTIIDFSAAAEELGSAFLLATIIVASTFSVEEGVRNL